MNSFPRHWRKRAAQAAIIVLLLTLCHSNAWSINCWLSDESGFDFHDEPYAFNEPIYISGEWDHFEFPCATGDVYLVPNDGTTWTGTVPISKYIAKTTIMGCGGFGDFWGEVLMLQARSLGQYDIVMDEDQDGQYNQGVDYILGDGPGYALIVINQRLDQVVDVAKIKASALKEANSWNNYATWTEVSLTGLGLVSTAVTAFQLAVIHPALGVGYLIVGWAGNYLGYAMDYNGVVRKIGCAAMTTAGRSIADAKLSLAADPPDYNYSELVYLGPIVYEEEISTSSLNNSAVRLRNALAEQSALSESFRRSYEKFLGAESDVQYGYALVQTRFARMYCSLLLESLESSLTQLDSLKTAIQATGWADSVFSAAGARTLQQRVATSGFTQAEIDTFRAIGMLPQEIDSVESEIAGMNLSGLTDESFQSLIDSLSHRAVTATGYYDSVAENLDSALVELQNAYSSFPSAVISSAASVAEGTPLTLDGRSSSDPEARALSYAWDTNADGVFDNGADGTAQFLPNRQGEYLVGLRVTNSLGQSDAAYKRITVIDVNRIPYFAESEPDAIYLVISGRTCDFSVVVGDPDNESVSVTWLVGDETVGSGLSYHFVAPDTGLYLVRARASDGSPLSPDNYHGWRVRVIGTSTGFDQEHATPRGDLALHQNYPNPFNPTTTISFILPEDTHVRLSIYDVLGRLVKVLADERLRAGYHEVVWNGTDASGSPASSGVYFCSIQAGRRELIKKMVLLR